VGGEEIFVFVFVQYKHTAGVQKY